LPAVVDTEQDGSLVVNFRGAGQGPRALVAEALVALVARRLDLPVYVAMRNWHPFIRETMERIAADAVERLVAICLAPP